jgi:hypothetical protein
MTSRPGRRENIFTRGKKSSLRAGGNANRRKQPSDFVEELRGVSPYELAGIELLGG